MNRTVLYIVPKIPKNKNTIRNAHAKAILDKFDGEIITFEEPPDYFFKSSSVVNGKINLVPRILKIVKNKNPKLIVTSFHFRPALIGFLCKYNYNKTWLVDFFDDPWQYKYNSFLYGLAVPFLVSVLKKSDLGIVTYSKKSPHVYGKTKYFNKESVEMTPYQNRTFNNEIKAACIEGAFNKESWLVCLKALKKSEKNYHITFIGPDPDNEVQNLAKSWGLEGKTEFTGHVSHSRVLEILSKCNVGIWLPKPRPDWEYVTNRTVCEYMVSSLCPVVSDFQGMRELVGNAGIRIKPNAHSLIKALNKLDSNENFFKKIRQDAFEKIKNYDNNGFEKSISDKLDP